MAIADEIRPFREGVAKAMPNHVKLLSTVPKLSEMIASIGGAHLYSLYNYLSQYAHGGYPAADIYRRHLGYAKETGDFVTSTQWHIAFRLCYLSLSEPVDIVFSRVSNSPLGFLSPERKATLASAIQAVAEEQRTSFH